MDSVVCNTTHWLIEGIFLESLTGRILTGFLKGHTLGSYLCFSSSQTAGTRDAACTPFYFVDVIIFPLNSGVWFLYHHLWEKSVNVYTPLTHSTRIHSKFLVTSHDRQQSGPLTKPCGWQRLGFLPEILQVLSSGRSELVIRTRVAHHMSLLLDTSVRLT